MLVKLTKDEKAVIEPLVDLFEARRTQQLFTQFQEQVVNAFQVSDLMPLIHSIRSRIKDPSHLRDKLHRQLLKCQKTGKAFDVTPENLFTKINDLLGVRLLHLHTRQIKEIDKQLREIVTEARLELKEKPFARTWDDESRAFFKALDFDTPESATSMYTSVHYILTSNSLTTLTCEVQVRTLMEEVWGEVDHTFNYPHPTDSVTLHEQIRSLARATSAASRLVDSIFATAKNLEETKPRRKKKSAAKVDGI